MSVFPLECLILTCFFLCYPTHRAVEQEGDIWAVAYSVLNMADCLRGSSVYADICEKYYAVNDDHSSDSDFRDDDDTHVLYRLKRGMSAEAASWSADVVEKLLVSQAKAMFLWAGKGFNGGCLSFRPVCFFQSPVGKSGVPYRPPPDTASTPPYPYPPFCGGDWPGGRVASACLDQLVILNGGVHSFEDLAVLCGIPTSGINTE